MDEGVAAYEMSVVWLHYYSISCRAKKGFYVISTDISGMRVCVCSGSVYVTGHMLSDWECYLLTVTQKLFCSISSMCRKISPSLGPPAGYLPLHAACSEQPGRNLPESHHLLLSPPAPQLSNTSRKKISGKTSKDLRIDFFWQRSHLYSVLCHVDCVLQTKRLQQSLIIGHKW